MKRPRILFIGDNNKQEIAASIFKKCDLYTAKKTEDIDNIVFDIICLDYTNIDFIKTQTDLLFVWVYSCNNIEEAKKVLNSNYLLEEFSIETTRKVHIIARACLLRGIII